MARSFLNENPSKIDSNLLVRILDPELPHYDQQRWRELSLRYGKRFSSVQTISNAERYGDFNSVCMILLNPSCAAFELRTDDLLGVSAIVTVSHLRTSDRRLQESLKLGSFGLRTVLSSPVCLQENRDSVQFQHSVDDIWKTRESPMLRSSSTCSTRELSWMWVLSLIRW